VSAFVLLASHLRILAYNSQHALWGKAPEDYGQLQEDGSDRLQDIEAGNNDSEVTVFQAYAPWSVVFDVPRDDQQRAMI
jgi:hypothetical protein